MAISLSALGTAYRQNFDTLSSTASSTTNVLAIPGWVLNETGGGARDNEQYAVDTGGSTTGDIYSYGAAGASDRSLGSLRSGALIPTFGAFFDNNTGSALTSLDLSYVGEQWRLGTTGRSDRLDFQYSLNATSLTDGTWIDINVLDFTTPDMSTIGAKNGNETARTSLSSSITGLNIPVGASFGIRWMDVDAPSADDGLAVDDFSLTANGSGGGTGGATVSIADASVIEGENGTKLLTFTVSRSNNTGTFTVDYITANGTATADEDYVPVTAAPNTVNFTVGGVLTQQISVTINGDGMSEANETFGLNLGNVVNTTGTATIGDGAAIGTITNDDFSLTPIYTIQGASHFSNFDGQAVTTRGIVTALFSNGFYIQDATGDGNAATSDGIFVFTNAAPTVAVGADVTVDGTVTEFRGTNANDLTLTEIVTPTITVNSFNNALPAAVVLGDGMNGTRRPPLVDLGDNDRTGTYNPATQGTDFYESLEGMRVTITDAVTTGPFRSNFGEVVVRYNVGENLSVNSRGGLTISDTTPGTVQPADKRFDFNPERLQLDDRAGGSTPVPTATGDRLGEVTGVLSYEFGAYDLNSTQNVSIVTPSTLTRETTTIAANLDRVRVVSFNVENLAPVGQPVDGVATPQSKFNGLADAIINNLGSPEIIALQEVLDNDGATNSTTVSASATLTQLIDAIVARGGPRYTAIDSVPLDDTVGGIPGGNQRVAYLYDASAVTPTARNNLTPVVGTNGAVMVAPTASQIGQDNPDFAATRRSLPIEWAPVGFTDAEGGTFHTINNHLSSKGGSAPLYGNLLDLPLHTDPLNGAAQSTNGSNEREGQAEAINTYIDSILTNGRTSDDRVVALGDFNDFQFFPVIDLITGQLMRTVANPDGTPSVFAAGTPVLSELADQLPVAERYSYNFDGNAQALDQILVSTGLYASTQFDIVHINSEFATQLSDHDPSVASIALPRSAAIATAGNDVFDQAAYTARFGAIRGSLAGNDTFDGLAGDDRFVGGAGNDIIAGGANGTLGDTSVYTGARSSYTVTALGAGAFQIRDDRSGSNDGLDTVSDIERFEFSDGVRTAAQLTETPPPPPPPPAEEEPEQTGTIPGTSADETLTGDGLDNTFMAGGGADIVRAGGGADVVYGNQGADIIYGNQDADQIFGGQGDDRAFGGQGNDVVSGNLGNDVLSGNLGADIVYGNQGADIIYGNQDADQLFGGQGNDVLFGGQGNDVLAGNLGDDLLVGGLGADRFVFAPISGQDRIIGFNQVDGDRLSLSGQTYTIGTAADGDALLALSGGGFIELDGLRVDQVNDGFFI